METLGARLKRARQYAVLSQEELAAASGVSVVTISRLENDQQEAPRPSTIRKLAKALDVAPGWLLFGNDDEGKAAA